MKTKILPLLVLSMVLLAVSLSLHAQPAGSRFRQKSGRSQVHQPSKSGDPRFDLAWKQADSLMNLGQPQSALAVVGKIFILAKKENNEPQVVKSVLYQIRLSCKNRSSARKKISPIHPGRPGRSCNRSLQKFTGNITRTTSSGSATAPR